MTKLIRYITWLSILFLCKDMKAQAPSNDNCGNASQIAISDDGFGLDTFISAKTDVEFATRQIGEHCAGELEDNGNCVKTVWYKFYVPTTRNVGVRLTQQDSAIPQVFSGFCIYRLNGCSYTVADISSQLTPLGKFGTSGNTCLASGWYMIQVGCKKKAKGELWLELQVSKPSKTDFDDFSKPYIFSKPNQVSAYPECATIDREEQAAINDSNFSRSLWFAIPISPDVQFLSLRLLTTVKVKYRIFDGNVNKDSLASTKPFLSPDADAYLLKIQCPQVASSHYYYIQFVVSSETTSYIELDFQSYTANTTSWNIPSQALQADLSINKAYLPGRLDYGCMSRLSTHSCKNSIPPYFTTRVNNYSKQQWQVDTYAYGGYMILNIPQDGLLQAGSSYIRNTQYILSLYEGDIRQSCNLKHVWDTLLNYETMPINCVKKGTYTLVIAVKNITDYIEPQISLNVDPGIPKYIYPATPEKLPDIDPDLAYVSSEYTSLSPDTTIVISNMSFRGKFIYREFYVSKPGDMDIAVPDKIDGFLHLFSGQMSKGTVAAIPAINYKGIYRSTAQIAASSTYATSCMHFNKGYYTLIAWVPINPKYDLDFPCRMIYNSIYLHPVSKCPAYNNTEPMFAFPVHGNRDVLDTVAVNGNYTYSLPGCQSCYTRSKVKPFISCSIRKYVTNVDVCYYYTFYLSENASLFLNTQYYELYKGNVLTDPNIITDSSLIVAPCNDGTTICNLQGPQVYTLVHFYNPTLQINFARIRVTPNDFADHAYDIGHIVSGTIKTPEFPVTCHTNGFPNEPSRYQSYANGTKFSIPFPDTQNLKRNITSRKTLWFTFTASGNSTIILKPTRMRTFTGFDECTYLLKYKGAYHQDFADVLKDGFDSTDNMMEPVLSENIYYDYDSIKFVNEGCSNQRYFVVYSYQKRSYYDYDYVFDYGLTLRVKPDPHPMDGDYCGTAIQGKYKAAGKYYLRADNACHTFGNNIYEETYDPEIKSTWFSIEVDSLEKFNLSIRSTKGGALQSYTVYGGTCGGMTRIATQGDRYAYFTLNCLGKGHYYIQAIYKKGFDEKVEFEVTLEDASKSPCKPYDFKYPIAQFDYKGGCQYNDTIRLRNLSSKGDDIEYTWYLNGQLLDHSSDPTLFRTDKRVLPINNIRLIVTNTFWSIKDTFDLMYKKDTTIYKFKALGPKTIDCNDTMTLDVSTNYPAKINYTWMDFRKEEISSYKSFKYYFPYTVPFYVSGESDNCFFMDSILVTKIMSLKKYRDSTYCAWNPYTIKNNDAYFPIYIYANNYFAAAQPGETYTFPRSGLYMVSYIQNKCYYIDSVKINIMPGVRFVQSSDEIYACNIPGKLLQYTKDLPPKYKWNTGDTTPFIYATKSGKYMLTGAFSKCSSLDYTVYLTLAKLDTNILKDTVVCKYDRFPFRNPLGSNFKVVYKQPAKDTIVMTGPVSRVLRLQRGECLVNDSAMTDIFPFEGRTIDSFLCNTEQTFSMFIDGRVAKMYDWYLNGHEAKRLLAITGYGNYPVARIDKYGCKDTLNFNVITNCEFTVFVPNAFTPNDDYTNERFGPVVSGRFKKYDMLLFNNWGEIVFQTNSSQPWNGLYKGSYTQGVYGYFITVYDQNGTPYQYRGTVTLIL